MPLAIKRSNGFKKWLNLKSKPANAVISRVYGDKA